MHYYTKSHKISNENIITQSLIFIFLSFELCKPWSKDGVAFCMIFRLELVVARQNIVSLVR